MRAAIMFIVLPGKWTLPHGYGIAPVPAPFALGIPFAEFDHHERGHNRTMKFNTPSTAESGA